MIGRAVVSLIQTPSLQAGQAGAKKPRNLAVRGGCVRVHPTGSITPCLIVDVTIIPTPQSQLVQVLSSLRSLLLAC